MSLLKRIDGLEKSLMLYDSDDSASVDATPERPRGLVIETTPNLRPFPDTGAEDYLSPGGKHDNGSRDRPLVVNGSPNHAHIDTVVEEEEPAKWAGQSNILVAVRIRPLLKHDKVQKSVVRVLDHKMVVILDPAKAREEAHDVLRQGRSREKKYAFDHVFDENDDTSRVYAHTTKFMIQGVLDGFNATVFAYGQTGAGKTHTMIGDASKPGIMVQTLRDLFAASRKGNGKGSSIHICLVFCLFVCIVYFSAMHKVTVSFLEVYNENIRDLLSEMSTSNENLDLREDPIKGPVVAGITEVEVDSAAAIMTLLEKGNMSRMQAATAANEVSSRSHAVLQVVVENREAEQPGHGHSKIKIGKLSLVDLAGSERAAATKNRGARLQEGANINRSLLALGNCINALGEKGRGAFVPYRDSKLSKNLISSFYVAFNI